MKLSIHLVTWNGEKWLAPFFDSFKQCQLLDVKFQLFVLDNGSTDGTVEFIKKELANAQFQRQFIELKENLGFAGGHNRLFQNTDAELVMIVNQDLEFEPDCIVKLARFMNEHTDAAAVAPRLMRMSEKHIIDSLGLKKYRSWRVVDSGSGKNWEDFGKKYDKVFGVSGACAMFRMSDLRAVAFPDGSIFDESYGSYKEDVDLAFRLLSRGRKSYVALDAVAYHARGSGNGKKDQPFRIRHQSYRNHLLTIFKNFSWKRAIDLPFILWYEIRKFVWYFFMDPKVLVAWSDLWRMKKEIYERRKHCIR